ncbi:MAG: tyrosine-protein kinase family protein [Planctomycetota bacterium]
MNPRLQRIARRVEDDKLLLAFTEARRRLGGEVADLRGNVTAITSSASREGKTYVAIRLAIQNARLHGRRTLLVDAAPDRRGSMSRLIANSKGASDRSGESVCSGTGLANLDLLSWGPRLSRRSPDGSLHTDPLSEVLAGVSANYDLVLIDSVSMADGPAVLGILRCASRVVFVVEHRRLSAPQIRAYLDRIDTPPVLGVVLNKRRYPIPGFLYRRL